MFEVKKMGYRAGEVVLKLMVAVALMLSVCVVAGGLAIRGKTFLQAGTSLFNLAHTKKSETVRTGDEENGDEDAEEYEGDKSGDPGQLIEALKADSPDGAGSLNDSHLPNDAAPEGKEPRGKVLKNELDSYLDENFPLTGVPGAAVAVVDSHGIRYLSTLGNCADANSSFLIGSLSKSFTAVAIMQLVQNGRIDLDAPVVSYVAQYHTPEFVTVRDLLNQTSGFSFYDSLTTSQVGSDYGQFSYANANYDLLGRIVEQVSGQDFASYVQDNLLGPLNMTDTKASGMIDSKQSVRAYRTWFGVNVADGFSHAQSDKAWGGPSSGYVASSVADMARYLQMFLNVGGKVLDPSSVRSMFLDRVPDPHGDTFYGMGWTSYYWDDGEMALSHDGLVENYAASMCVLPERDIGIIVLGNSGDDSTGSNTFFQMTSDVVSVAIGAEPTGVDNSLSAWSHTHFNTFYLFCFGMCLVPLLSLRVWVQWAGRKSLLRILLQDLVLHAVVPLLILLLPFWWGIPWSDVVSFTPDEASVLIACAFVLVLTGFLKVGIYKLRKKRVAKPVSL